MYGHCMVKRCKKNQKPAYYAGLITYGGGHEIRTHGSLHFATFPRWCLKPLGQSSKGKYYYNQSDLFCHAKNVKTNGDIKLSLHAFGVAMSSRIVYDKSDL